MSKTPKPSNTDTRKRLRMIPDEETSLPLDQARIVQKANERRFRRIVGKTLPAE